ncbi:MAG TPA: hypothetical protein VNZ49_12760 [Bacteroidia bacterium]|nr:hypothetical protein [Bacteroidia bacterium]
MKYTLPIFLFLLISFFCAAQNTLVLETNGFKIKQRHFYRQDEISLKVKSGQKTYSGKIIAIGDSAIIIANKKRSDTIVIKEIRMLIFNRTNRISSAFSKLLIRAGIGIIIIDAFNNVIHDENTIIKPRIVIIGACLVSTGILIKLLEKKRVSLGKRKKLKVINLSPY